LSRTPILQLTGIYIHAPPPTVPELPTTDMVRGAAFGYSHETSVTGGHL